VTEYRRIRAQSSSRAGAKANWARIIKRQRRAEIRTMHRASKRRNAKSLVGRQWQRKLGRGRRKRAGKPELWEQLPSLDGGPVGLSLGGLFSPTLVNTRRSLRRTTVRSSRSGRLWRILRFPVLKERIKSITPSFTQRLKRRAAVRLRKTCPTGKAFFAMAHSLAASTQGAFPGSKRQCCKCAPASRQVPPRRPRLHHHPRARNRNPLRKRRGAHDAATSRKGSSGPLLASRYWDWEWWDPGLRRKHHHGVECARRIGPYCQVRARYSGS